MDCEGTSHAPSFGSLLFSLSHCFTLPPSLHSHLSLFSLFFFLSLAGYSFYSSGITELKPNSSLARLQKGTTSRDVHHVVYVHPIHIYSMLCTPPPLSMVFISVTTATIPRSALQWFIRYFLDTDSSFVTVTVGDMKHLSDSSSHSGVTYQ